MATFDHFLGLLGFDSQARNSETSYTIKRNDTTIKFITKAVS